MIDDRTAYRLFDTSLAKCWVECATERRSLKLMTV